MLLNLISAGIDVGLFEALRDGSFYSCSVLSQKTKTNKRVLRELLNGLASGGILEWKREEEIVFGAKKETIACLCDNNDPRFILGLVESTKGFLDVDGKSRKDLVTFLRSGKGKEFGSSGSDFTTQMELMHEPFVKFQLFNAMKSNSVLRPFLNCQSVVGDVGCGGGQILRHFQAKNPSSKYVGFDIDSTALQRARERSQNITFVHCVEEDTSIYNNVFDLAMTTDAIHDCDDPMDILRLAFNLLKPGAIYFMVEPTSYVDIEKQLKDPSSSFKYGVSIHGCLASAMSGEKRVGLGLLGLNPEVLKRLLEKTGFVEFQQFPVKFDKFNSYYTARKPQNSNL